MILPSICSIRQKSAEYRQKSAEYRSNANRRNTAICIWRAAYMQNPSNILSTDNNMYSTCQSVCFQSGDDLIRRRHRPRAPRGDQQHHVSECACSNVHIKVTVFLPFPPLSLSREFPIRCARFCRAKGRVHSLRDGPRIKSRPRCERPVLMTSVPIERPSKRGT